MALLGTEGQVSCSSTWLKHLKVPGLEAPEVQ